jgi:YD repeat-containing protein
VTDELSHTVTTTLDGAGNATSIIDAGGNRTTFTFDALNLGSVFIRDRNLMERR